MINGSRPILSSFELSDVESGIKGFPEVKESCTEFLTTLKVLKPDICYMQKSRHCRLSQLDFSLTIILVDCSEI